MSRKPRNYKHGLGGARWTDPHTSAAAAAMVNASQRRAEFAEEVHKSGEHGATAYEVHKRSGIRLNSVTPRQCELQRLGIIRIKTYADGRQVTRAALDTDAEQLVYVIRKDHEPFDAVGKNFTDVLPYVRHGENCLHCRFMEAIDSDSHLDVDEVLAYLVYTMADILAQPECDAYRKDMVKDCRRWIGQALRPMLNGADDE